MVDLQSTIGCRGHAVLNERLWQDQAVTPPPPEPGGTPLALRSAASRRWVAVVVVCVAVVAASLLAMYRLRSPRPAPQAPPVASSGAAAGDPAEASARTARAYLTAVGEDRSAAACEMMISGLRSQCREDVRTEAPLSQQSAFVKERSAMRAPVYVTPEAGTQGAFVCVRLSRVMIRGEALGNCPTGTDLRMSLIKEPDGWKVAALTFGFSDMNQIVGP